MKSDLKERNYTSQSHLIVNAKYIFSNSEIDMILTLLTAIGQEDKDFKDYVFTLAEFNKKTNKSTTTKELKHTIKGLMSKTIEINTTSNGWKIFNWFSYFQFEKGVITCRFDKELKPYLLEIQKRFVVSDLRMLLKIKSSYSKRIYLLLKEYSKIGKRTFEVENIQEILKVPKSFTVYSEFKKKVLKRAEIDINKFTDLEVKLIEKKRGRKVVEVSYSIKKNQVDLKSFISIVREMYVNKILYHTKENRPIMCSEKGFLYYADMNEYINKKESQKLWEYLHEHRKDLECYEKFNEKDAIKRLMLSDFYIFVKYMRENYTNQDVMKAISSETQKEMMVSISFTGDLYDKIEEDYFDRAQNQNLWNMMYNLAKQGKLKILDSL
jgi:plasmid replication initiation protein